MRFLRYGALSFLILLVGFQLPKAHYNWVRAKVAAKTVEILRTDGIMSGGTGVQIILPSGKTGILSNAHVCAIKDKDGMVLVNAEFLARPIPRKVIEESGFTDLCLIEPLPGMSGLSFGADTQPGDIVAAIGHPHLMPITMTRGETIAVGEVMILDHIMDFDEPETSCKLPKQKILEFVTIFGKLRVCVMDIQATYSTIPILPGNSGSPVVNAYGNLVGLIFAGNELGWGVFITLDDIKRFVAPY